MGLMVDTNVFIRFEKSGQHVGRTYGKKRRDKRKKV